MSDEEEKESAPETPAKKTPTQASQRPSAEAEQKASPTERKDAPQEARSPTVQAQPQLSAPEEGAKPPTTSPPPPSTPPKPTAPATAPPRPAPPLQPQPQAAPRPGPTKPTAPPARSRRDFLKIVAGFSGFLAALPFVPWGEFLSASSAPPRVEKQRLVTVEGEFVNVDRFPANSFAVFPYPRTGDPKLDFEPFRRWVLIRLPSPEGDRRDASAFRAYSQICVHLWCLWQYRPEPQTANCPCHGSIYDPKTGVSIRGPASLQSPPNNALAKLDLEVDNQGFLEVLPPTFDVNKNGVVGRGRYVT